MELDEHEQPVGALAVFQGVAARVDGVADGPKPLFEPAGRQRHVRWPSASEAAPGELALDERVHLVKPAVKCRDTGGAAVGDERPPERNACKRRLDAWLQRGDGRRVAAPRLGGEEPFEGVAQVPLAEVEVGHRPARPDGARHAGVVVADHALWPAAEPAQKRRPVRGAGVGECLQAPDARLAALVAHCGEDVEDDAAARDGLAVGVERLDAKRQVVEHQRALARPRVGAVRLEDDGSEDLATQSATSCPCLESLRSPVAGSARSRRARSRATLAARM